MPELTVRDEPVPIAVAAKLFFPHGGVTVSTLRSAIRRGELQCEVIGRGYCVTGADIRKWRELCRRAALDRISVSDPKTKTAGSISAEDRMKAAQAALAALINASGKK